MNIRVLFTTQSKLASWVIRKLTKSEVSHAAICIDEVVYQSRFLEKGVGSTSAGKMYAEVDVVREYSLQLDLSSEDISTMYVHLAKYKGTPYSVLNIFGFVYQMILELLRAEDSLKLFRDYVDRMTCAEYVVRVLKAANMLRPGLPAPDLVHPEMLMQHIDNDPLLWKRVK